jgi:hypothetical protein
MIRIRARYCSFIQTRTRRYSHVHQCKHASKKRWQRESMCAFGDEKKNERKTKEEEERVSKCNNQSKGRCVEQRLLQCKNTMTTQTTTITTTKNATNLQNADMKREKKNVSQNLETIVKGRHTTRDCAVSRPQATLCSKARRTELDVERVRE